MPPHFTRQRQRNRRMRGSPQTTIFQGDFIDLSAIRVLTILFMEAHSMSFELIDECTHPVSITMLSGADLALLSDARSRFDCFRWMCKHARPCCAQQLLSSQLSQAHFHSRSHGLYSDAAFWVWSLSTCIVSLATLANLTPFEI